MSLQGDVELIEIAGKTIKRTAIPIAILAAGFFAKALIDIPVWKYNLGEFISMVLAVFAGYVASQIHGVMRGDIKELNISTAKKINYGLLLSLTSFAVLISGYFAILEARPITEKVKSKLSAESHYSTAQPPTALPPADIQTKP